MGLKTGRINKSGHRPGGNNRCAGLVDMVLIMSVEPDLGSGVYTGLTLKKIRKLRMLADKAGLSLDIEVDGGITADNVRQVLESREQCYCIRTANIFRAILQIISMLIIKYLMNIRFLR